MIICIGRRPCRFRRCLGEPLIFKSLLLVYYYLWQLYLLTYHPTAFFSSYFYYYSRILYLYTDEHRCTHCLSFTLDFLSLQSTRHYTTGLIYYISYLLLVCYVDSCDAIIMHLSSQLQAVSVSK